MGNALAKLSAATTALAEAKTLQEVKKVLDIAESARIYAKAAKLGLQAQNHAAEVKLRAERKAGDMLKKMEKNKGNAGTFNGRTSSGGRIARPPEENAPKLADLGITKTQSSQWQAVADLPDDVFEDYIVTATAKAEVNSKAELTSKDVHKLAKSHREHEERKAMAQSGKTVAVPADVQLYHAPFQTVCEELPEASVDFILTDPPYPGEFIPEWLDLAVAAKRVLKPGGYLFAYSGQLYLPDYFSQLGQHLDYVWTACVPHTGGTNHVPVCDVINAWKPILIYTNGVPSRSLEGMVDMFSGGKGDKTAHDWAQPESEARYFIEKMTRPGDIVLDPFMGSGTIPRAAHRLGRVAIGCEIDEQKYLIARSTFDDKTS